ncbi:MAG: hypothetical protein HYY17_10145 [Planctomycetes bacterium]|nr:hypothetical protein [Planctomycetota bacterium]
MRAFLSATVTLGVLFACGWVSAQEEGWSASRECTFKAHNPVILKVGDCEDGHGVKWISVLTNTRTKVSMRNTDFIRFERDLEGNILETYDRIPAVTSMFFDEIVLREDGGAPLEVKRLGESLWGVNPHRGGYRIGLALSPCDADLTDDAGCYTATATVTVTAEPFEDCRDLEED